MIEMTTWVWFAAGGVAGLMHATMLWRAMHRLSVWTPVLGILRLGFVAAVLILSALSGVILASAAGWAIGFAALGTRIFISGSSQTAASSNTHCNE